jgi:hypothetical protein
MINHIEDIEDLIAARAELAEYIREGRKIGLIQRVRKNRDRDSFRRYLYGGWALRESWLRTRPTRASLRTLAASYSAAAERIRADVATSNYPCGHDDMLLDTADHYASESRRIAEMAKQARR